MSGIDTQDSPPPGRNPSPNRLYIILALVLVAVIVLVAVVLITRGIPALRRSGEATATLPVAVVAATPTLNPTFTPGPTQEPLPAPSATAAPPSAPVMADVVSPTVEFVSAGGRPGSDWTGFFGQVLDAQDNPVPDVPVIVWYPEGRPAADPVRTDATGSYEIRLADGVLGGIWSIQVLTADMQPASKLYTFQTDENGETGIQQIQVIWRQVP